jgi:release factor glutamine methyltransferase
MLTILDVVRRTTGFFEKCAVPQPQLDAEWIIAHSLNLARMDLYLQFERPLGEDQLAPIRKLVKRRGAREPLQHLIGFVDFFGLRITCDKRALIPRPETEEFIEIINRKFAAKPPCHILDLGTGSGALALAFAKIFPSAQVVATDISSDALELAQENAATNKLSDKVSFHLGDWFEALPKNEATFDLIVSNPPYLSHQEWECTQREVREHDPKLALVSENEGCDHLLNILTAAKQHLRHGGLLAMETGEFHHELLIERAQEAGLCDARGMKDLSKKPRFFLAARPPE